MFRNKIELTFSLFIVAMLAWALWESRAWPPQSRFFPGSIGITVLCLALVQLGVTVRKMLRSETALDNAVPYSAPSLSDEEKSKVSREGSADPKLTRRRAIIMQWWIIIFFLGIWLLGFKVGAFVLTFTFLRLAAHESWGISGAFAVLSYLFFLAVFDFALQVPLAAGLIADSLELNSLDQYLVGPFLSVLNAMTGA